MSCQARPLDKTIHRDEIKYLKRGYAKLGTRRTDHARSQRKSAHIARMRLSSPSLDEATEQERTETNVKQGKNLYA